MMGRVGCVLMLVAMLALCGLVVLPVLPFLEASPTLDNLLQPLLCQPGERIERDQYSTSTGRSGMTFTMSVYCLNDDGQRRDESDRWVIISFISFSLPFLLGLMLFITGVSRAKRRMEAAAPPTPVVSKRLPSLTERLQELDAARQAGLISDEEYARARQNILDDLA